MAAGRVMNYFTHDKIEFEKDYPKVFVEKFGEQEDRELRNPLFELFEDVESREETEEHVIYSPMTQNEETKNTDDCFQSNVFIEAVVKQRENSYKRNIQFIKSRSYCTYGGICKIRSTKLILHNINVVELEDDVSKLENYVRYCNSKYSKSRGNKEGTTYILKKNTCNVKTNDWIYELLPQNRVYNSIFIHYYYYNTNKCYTCLFSVKTKLYPEFFIAEMTCIEDVDKFIFNFDHQLMERDTAIRMFVKAYLER